MMKITAIVSILMMTLVPSGQALGTGEETAQTQSTAAVARWVCPAWVPEWLCP
jgi:hypothetical protein